MVKLSGHGDLHIPFQRLRHSAPASYARWALYRLLVGKEGYPFTFLHVAEGDEASYPPSANLYIHIPFCRSICTHCPYNKVIFRDDSSRAYGAALTNELARYLARPDLPPVQTLYFGGGTPSMTPQLIEQIIAQTRPAFAPQVEIGVEVHPRDATIEQLLRLKRAGVNRVSLGIETFEATILRVLGRAYTPDQAVQAIQNARAVGFDCVDVNLIYGIPGQTTQRVLDDVSRCIALGVEHLSAYPLITFEHTRLGKLVRAGQYREFGDRERTITQRAVARMCLDHGFTRTSVWSFTRADAPAYSTVTRDSYVGFGAGAGSKVGGEFWFNTFSVPEYTRLAQPRPAIRLKTSDTFTRAHWLYWQVYKAGIDLQQYQDLFHRDLLHDFRLVITLMRLLRWVRRDGRLLRMTERGARWSHRFQMLFSLTFIDDVWTQCQKEPWPERIVLY